MKQKLLSLFAACALFLPLACDNAEVNDPTLHPSFAAGGNGQSLRDTDTNTEMPADTSVGIGDVINMALYAGNNGLQNNQNVVWTNSNPVAVSLVSNGGTATAVAQALGTSTVCATHGANSSCVVITVTAGPGVAYVVTSTSYAPAAGSSVTISAQLVDASNNPAPEAGRIVTWSSTNGGSFIPTTSVTNGSGIAATTFTVSTVAGTTHVVTATDNLAASGSSAPIIVQPAAAANMVAYAGQGQSATVGTAVAVDPAVRVTDAFNNPVSGVIVNFTVTSGGGSATGTLQITDANGVATVGSWTLGNTPGSNTLDAISAGLPTVTFTATATVGAATQLVMDTQPSSTAQAGVQFAQQPAVQLQDGLGNDVATAGVVVTASIATGAGTLAGTLTATTDANGLATFTNLRIDGATGTRTLRFQASGVTNAISDPINVGAGPADHLAMVQQPSSTAQAGVQFAQQPSVRLEDQFNNPVAQSGVSVTAAIASGGGTLLGTTSVNTDANGVASYTDLAIAGTVGPRTLSFSATGVTSAASNTINVGAGPAADILLTAPDSTVLPGSTVTITGQLRDQYGNDVPQVVAVNWSSTNGGSFSANPTNTDGSGETTVDFTVSASANVTHVVTATAGSATGNISITTVNTAPTANNDTFNAIGNVTIPVPAPGVLVNDTDPETSASAVPGPITTTNGGTVQMNADGSFTYLSAAGFTGTDTFNYTVTDGSDSDIAQVTMNVPNRVWYAKSDATAPGDGRDTSPFALLKDAELASTAGETVLVFYGFGTVTNYDQGFVFKTGQSLIGQGIPADLTATVNGVPVILLPAGNAPYVTRAMGGTTIQLASNNTLRGFNIESTNGAGIAGTGFGSFTASSTQVSANGGAAVELANGSINATFTQLSSSASAASGISLTSLTGTLDAPAGSLTGAASTALQISGGNAAISYGGSITSVVQRPVQISLRTGGAVTIDGPINANGLGILVSNNSGGSVTFTGSVSVSTAETGVRLTSNAGSTVDFTGGGLVIAGTSAGSGYVATGGGTISVTGAGNTIATMGGPGLDVENTTIATTGLTFQSVSVNGAPFGIALVNTGTAGGLTVTGAGGACHRSATACSGGTIGGNVGADGAMAGTSVYLVGTRGVSLSNMRFTGASNFAIRGSNVTNFDGDALLIDGVFGTSVPLEEAAVAFDNLSGTASIDNSFIAGGVTDNVRVRNTGAIVLTSFAMNADTIGLNHTLTGRDGIQLSSTGGTFAATVNATRFLGSRASPFAMRASGTANADLTFTNNQVANAHTNKITGAAGVALSAGGAVGDNVTVDYTITGNTVIGSRGVGIAVTKTLGVASLNGVITGNVVGDPAIANSGSEQAAGMFVSHATKGTHRVRIDDNNVHQYSGAGGILIQAGGVSALADPGVLHDGVLQATVVNNTMSNPGTNNPGSFVDALFIAPGTNSGDQYTVCLNVGQGGSNDLANGGRPDEGGGAFSVIANSSGSNAILKLAGYPIATHIGSAAEGPIVSTLQSFNSTGGTGYAETPNLTTTYAGNNATGVSCNLP